MRDVPCYSYLRPGVANAIEEFKTSVYGENYDQEEAEAAAGKASRGNASKKRKEVTDAAAQISAAYDWAELADNGKVSNHILFSKIHIPKWGGGVFILQTLNALKFFLTIKLKLIRDVSRVYMKLEFSISLVDEICQ